MEFVYLLFILAGVVVFLVKPILFPPEKHKPSISPPKESGKARPKPFDPSSAVIVDSVVKGAAYVIDGDSIIIKKTQVRLYGIDAPELNHPYGKKAKWALVTLCKGQEIRAEITELDVHGRTVARCFLEDGRDLSAEMVKLDLAIDWPKYSGGEYSSLEVAGVRKKLWLADARQKGRMHVWKKFESNQYKPADKK